MTTTVCIPGDFVTPLPAPRGKMLCAGGLLSTGAARLPTDPLFYADLVLQNVVVNSRYRVIVDDTGEELAAGTAASAEVTLSGLAVYANPQLVKITVRKGTSAPKYEPLDAYAYMTSGEVSAYIAQVPDPIA